MSTDSVKTARAKLSEIYMSALGAKAMVLMAQGKPAHEDHPHTAPTSMSPEQTQEQMLKAEAFIGLLLEQIDAFAKSFDLPDGWWVADRAEDPTDGAEAGQQ